MKIKTAIHLLLLAVLTAALCFHPPLPVSAGNLPTGPMAGTQAEVWVDDDFDAGNAGGHTWGTDAFDTIQAGLNAAAVGATVHVAPGLYPEAVEIYNTVHLIGDPGDSAPGPGPNAPTIGGCPVGITFCSGIEFKAPANGTTIEGFIVRDHPRDTDGDPNAQPPVPPTNIGGFGIFSKNQFSAPVSNITINDNLFIDNRWEAIMFFSEGGDSSLYFDNVKALNNRVENTFHPEYTRFVGVECTNCRNSLIQGNVIDGFVQKGIWIASEATVINPNFTNGMGVLVTGNTVNGATTAAVELESFDSGGGLADPVLSGVTVTGNTFNRSSSVGSQGEYLVYIHRNGFSAVSNATVNNITISNNQMDHSYGAFAAIYATVADQLTITGNTITTTATLWQQGSAILLYNNGLDNYISGNQIHILNSGSTSTAGITLAYTPVVPGVSENFIISRNTITSASPMGSAGIHLTPGFSGSSSKSVTISENRITGFYHSLRFENTTDAHSFVVRGNSFSSNPGGVSSILAVPLTLENNWWGCSEGPGQPGCDVKSASVDADPWLTLSLTPNLSQLSPSTPQVFTAHLLTNSNSVDISALGLDVPSTFADFSTNLGQLTPPSTLLVDLIGVSTFTTPAPGVASICAQVDQEQVCKVVFIADSLVFLPTILR